MNSRVIIIAILIMIKVIGVASRVRADNIFQTWENYCNSQRITFEECDEDSMDTSFTNMDIWTKSIEQTAFEHKQNELRAKVWNEILKNNPNIFK